MSLPDFVQRMQAELIALQAKANALEKTLDGEMIKALPAVDQALLAAQHAAMSTYEHILALRLTKALTPEPAEGKN